LVNKVQKTGRKVEVPQGVSRPQMSLVALSMSKRAQVWTDRQTTDKRQTDGRTTHDHTGKQGTQGSHISASVFYMSLVHD